MKLEIILSVQPTGKKGNYRLGINTFDSKKHFKERGKEVLITLRLGEENIISKTSCGQPNNKSDSKTRKKGYDINGKKISNWIIDEGFNHYGKGNPTKLLFELTTNPLHLIFLRKSIPKDTTNKK